MLAKHLKATQQLIAAHFEALALVTLAIWVPGDFVISCISQASEAASDPQSFNDKATIAVSSISAILFALCGAAQFFVLMDAAAGKKLSPLAALSRAAQRIGTLTIAQFASAAALLVGFLFFIVPGVFALIFLFFVQPIIVAEGKSFSIDVIKRSFLLAKGRKLEILVAEGGLIALLALGGIVSSVMFEVLPSFGSIIQGTLSDLLLDIVSIPYTVFAFVLFKDAVGGQAPEGLVLAAKAEGGSNG